MLMKWNKTCTYNSCFGFFELEFPFQQLSVAFTGGGGAVKWPLMKLTEIPKQNKLSILHNNAYFTHPPLKWRVTDLNIVELAIFLPKKHQSSNNNNKTPNKNPIQAKIITQKNTSKIFPENFWKKRSKNWAMGWACLQNQAEQADLP